MSISASFESIPVSFHRNGDDTIRSTAISHRSQHLCSALIWAYMPASHRRPKPNKAPLEKTQILLDNLSPFKIRTPGPMRINQLAMPCTSLIYSIIDLAVGPPSSSLNAVSFYPSSPFEAHVIIGCRSNASTPLLCSTACAGQVAELCPKEEL
jgi:hypothetical protein